MPRRDKRRKGIRTYDIRRTGLAGVGVETATIQATAAVTGSNLVVAGAISTVFNLIDGFDLTAQPSGIIEGAIDEVFTLIDGAL